MPIYEYEDVRSGKRVELFRPIAQRDRVPASLRRVVSLTAGALFTGRAADPGSAAVAVPRAFRKLEETMPRRSIEKQCGFSTKQLKRVWNFN